MAAASRRRSISVLKPAARSSSAAAKGASVFPAAVTAAASGWGVIGRFTRKAATATPGHTPRPSSSNATTAMPVGGHKGVTFFSTSATRSPSRAAR